MKENVRSLMQFMHDNQSGGGGVHPSVIEESEVVRDLRKRVRQLEDQLYQRSRSEDPHGRRRHSHDSGSGVGMAAYKIDSRTGQPIQKRSASPVTLSPLGSPRGGMRENSMGNRETMLLMRTQTAGSAYSGGGGYEDTLRNETRRLKNKRFRTDTKITILIF